MAGTRGTIAVDLPLVAGTRGAVAVAAARASIGAVAE
jgi:hypothetical protein